MIHKKKIKKKKKSGQRRLCEGEVCPCLGDEKNLKQQIKYTKQQQQQKHTGIAWGPQEFIGRYIIHVL